MEICKASVYDEKDLQNKTGSKWTKKTQPSVLPPGRKNSLIPPIPPPSQMKKSVNSEEISQLNKSPTAVKEKALKNNQLEKSPKLDPI